ncbi:hypothetical protein PUN28_007381 [Cardiocondyla obscurior]|uniref:Secreted protein n=1 Tax=Cardiocondyla obscurior TaxID=286306 RepID=A0AAW2G527_9HYME
MFAHSFSIFSRLSRSFLIFVGCCGCFVSCCLFCILPDRSCCPRRVITSFSEQPVSLLVLEDVDIDEGDSLGFSFFSSKRFSKLDSYLPFLPINNCCCDCCDGCCVCLGFCVTDSASSFRFLR